MSKKKRDHYNVFFIDYGNCDLISYQNLRKISKKLFQFEPQTKKGYLAYVRSCGLDDVCGERSNKYFGEKVWEQKLVAKTVFKDRDYNYVMLYPRGKVDTANSINYKMIRKGYAKVDDETFSLPQNVSDELFKAQEYA